MAQLKPRVIMHEIAHAFLGHDEGEREPPGRSMGSLDPRAHYEQIEAQLDREHVGGVKR